MQNKLRTIQLFAFKFPLTLELDLNFYAVLMTISYPTIIWNNSSFNAIFLFFSLSQDQLDKLGVALRNACRDDELDLVNKPIIYIINEKQE